MIDTKKIIEDVKNQERNLGQYARTEIHLFVAGLPTHTPYKIVHKLKGNSSIQLRRCFRDVRYLGYKQHFGRGFKNLWARGYYCGSAGHVSQESVKRYINEQEGKDVFEYNVFGSPNQKIGQFASQTKLGEWS